VQHAIAAHGPADTPQLRAGIRPTLEPDGAYLAGERVPERFRG
jgi:hypothetical protein